MTDTFMLTDIIIPEDEYWVIIKSNKITAEKQQIAEGKYESMKKLINLIRAGITEQNMEFNNIITAYADIIMSADHMRYTYQLLMLYEY